MKPYWHEKIRTQEDFAALCELGKTWADIRNEYEQPEWCMAPGALDAMGCWSLIGRLVTGRAYCRVCEYSRDYVEGEGDAH